MAQAIWLDKRAPAKANVAMVVSGRAHSHLLLELEGAQAIQNFFQVRIASIFMKAALRTGLTGDVKKVTGLAAAGDYDPQHTGKHEASAQAREPGKIGPQVSRGNIKDLKRA
jgi:hypothetical protein